MGNRILYVARHGEQTDPTAEDPDLSDRGRQQATLLGQRLAGTTFASIRHSPARRTTQTAELVSLHLPGVPVEADGLLTDVVPSIPDPELVAELFTPAHAEFFAAISDEERHNGPAQAAAMLANYTGPGDGEATRRDLVITHNFAVAAFVRHALDAPDWRWMGLNSYTAGLTTVLYRPDRPATLVSFNDVGHLPPGLRGQDHAADIRV